MVDQSVLVVYMVEHPDLQTSPL